MTDKDKIRPEEPVSKDLRKAWQKAYYKEKDNILVVYDHLAGFIAGSNWQKEKMINKACDWLYQQQLVVSDMEKFIADFIKYMKG